MNTQLLIYQSAVPVTRAAHGDLSVEAASKYGFSRAVNSVPLMAVEFPMAAHEYAIVFGGTDTDTIPAVILGVRADENLFTAADGAWTAAYVPAFIRRYPFVFSRAEDRFVLCMDETYPGFNRDGKGERLFTADGAPAPYVEGVLNFLRDYQIQFDTTQRLCARLRDLGLLEPMQARVTMQDGQQISLGGFTAVNRDKLKALPRETLADMAASDELELIYLHLQSLRNLDRLRDRLAARPAAV